MGKMPLVLLIKKYEIQDPQELNDLEIKTIQEKEFFL